MFRASFLLRYRLSVLLVLFRVRLERLFRSLRRVLRNLATRTSNLFSFRLRDRWLLAQQGYRSWWQGLF